MLMPTENPWPLLIACLVTSALLWVAANVRQTATWYLAALLTLVLGAAGFAIDAFVHTERERVETEMVTLVRDFEAGDLDRTLAHFSPQALTERLMVAVGMKMVTVNHPLSIKDVSIELTRENSIATSRFRANGDVLLNGRSVGHQASYWELKWRLEAGEWRVVQIQELDPLRGTPINRVATVFGL